MLKEYLTIKSDSRTETVINKSRFIGRAFKVTDSEQVTATLAKIRKEHYDATHNCYAYVLRSGEARFSDDGEPSGTAGMPMMEVLKNKGVTDTLVIVTRYFGGILLGAGGLVRAYSGSTADAVNTAGIVRMTPGDLIEFSIDYARYNAIEPYLKIAGTVKDTEFTDCVTVRLMTESSLSDNVISTIIEKTDGRAQPRIIGSDYISCDITDKNGGK